MILNSVSCNGLVGQISRLALQPDGARPVAPSVIQAERAITSINADSGMVEVLELRALATKAPSTAAANKGMRINQYSRVADAYDQ